MTLPPPVTGDVEDMLEAVEAYGFRFMIGVLRVIGGAGHASYPRDTEFGSAWEMLARQDWIALCREHHQPCEEPGCEGRWCFVLTDAGRLALAADRLCNGVT